MNIMQYSPLSLFSQIYMRKTVNILTLHVRHSKFMQNVFAKGGRGFFAHSAKSVHTLRAIYVIREWIREQYDTREVNIDV